MLSVALRDRLEGKGDCVSIIEVVEVRLQLLEHSEIKRANRFEFFALDE